MNKTLEMYAPVVGRILIGILFLLASFGKFPWGDGFAGSVAYAQSVGIPVVNLAIILAFIIEFFGGLMLIFGFKTKIAAWALALFTIIVTLYFHMDFGDQTQTTMFLKNVAVLGGLLILASYGGGKCSLDNRKKIA